jgi:hypothetical protein
MEKIRFRVYVIPATSKTTINDALVELNDSVEYKSLPSGLHNVREDLMYDSQPTRVAENNPNL